MKKIYLNVTLGLFLLIGMVFIACEAPDQPTYGDDHPDPNPTGEPAPTLNSITPQEGYLKQIVTIQGSGFNTVPEYNFVAFGKKQADVLSATETQLEVKTPNIADATVDVKAAVKGSEFWSNTLEFTFKSVLAVITDEINWPKGVDADDEGNVYVGSATDGVIYMFAPDGSRSVFAEVAPNGAIGWGPEGYLYVCQQGEGKIVRISPDGGTVEDVVEVESPIDFDWDEDGNMYIVSNWSGLKMYDGSAVTHLVDIGNGKSCRVYGGAVYVTNIWDGQILKLSITDGGVGSPEIVYEGSSPVGLEIDAEGTLYYTEAWQKTLYTLTQDGSGEILFEGQLMTPMRYLTFHNKKLYIVYPGWADVGKVMSVYVGVEQAPNYGLQ